jgi:hypothetical protein
MTIYFAPGNTVRKLYVVLLAIQGNHVVDGGFFTVVIANGRSRHDDLFTVNYSNRRSRAALCVCSVRTRYNYFDVVHPRHSSSDWNKCAP